VTFAVLADFASVSAEGKLNVLGVWDQINPSALPAQILSPYLVMRFEAQVSEVGQKRALRLVLLDEDGEELMAAEAEMAVGTSPRPGVGPRMNHILRIPVLQLPKAGDYVFDVLVDQDSKASVPFRVNEPVRQLPEGQGGDGQ